MSKSSLTLDGAIRYAEIIAEEIDKAKLIINGKEVEKDFYKKVAEGNSITILVYLRGNDVGIIDSIKLIAKDGTVLHDKADIIKKSSNEGFLVGFKFYIEGRSLS